VNSGSGNPGLCSQKKFIITSFTLIGKFCDSASCIIGRKKSKKEEGMSSNARDQLEVFHDPFSNATTQPKIPDGKVVRSFGTSNNWVGELVNEAGEELLHIVLYAGQNTAMCARNIPPSIGGNTNDFAAFGFTDNGGANWIDITAAQPTDETDTIFQRDSWAQWRTVSCGGHFQLLNAAEEDDGWFEAVRLSEPFRNEDFELQTTSGGIDRNEGTIAPTGMLRQGSNFRLQSYDLANEPSYTTGLLRDIKNYQFELHGKKDHHDFTTCKSRVNLPSPLGGVRDLANFDQTRLVANFNTGASNEVQDLVNQFIDESYDMIYIRVHCRQNGADASLNGSRLHCNIVSNQEVQYPTNVKESRFETLSNNVGIDTCSKHATLRRMRGAAGSLV
jgi:hypothetical protein